MIHAVDSKGRVNIPTLITSIAHMFSSVIKIGDAVKFSEEAMDSFQGSAHRKVVG